MLQIDKFQETKLVVITRQDINPGYTVVQSTHSIADFAYEHPEVFKKWKEALGGKVRAIASGSAALQPRLARIFLAADIPILEGYGLTETSPVVSVNSFDKGICIGSVGALIDGVEVRITSDGEICVKGPNVMMGYYNNLEATQEVLDADGWFKTGDIGEFVEGNAWHYSWSVFQDFKGLSNLMGGNKVMESMLDSVFNQPPIFDGSAYRGGVIHEMTEMQVMNMGQYAHGNQPIQHMIYVYNYCGAPWKTQYHVRDAMNKLYRPTPDGYCGDEDNGQTSAWYVFSAMGFYSVCPGSQEYVLGSPLFKKITLNLDNGKKLSIEAPANNDQNVYIQSASLRGKPFNNNYITHDDLLKGGKLIFNMGIKPNLKRGVLPVNFPYSITQ